MTIEKIKVDKLSIVVVGTKEKPYFQICYHEVGKGYDNLGFWLILFRLCIQLERRML